MFQKTLLLAGLIFLSACTSGQVKKSISFNASSEDTLVLMGTNLKNYTEIKFTFKKFDPDSGKYIDEDKNLSFGHAGLFEKGGEKIASFVVTPGHWFLSGVLIQYAPALKTYVHLSQGSIAFEAKAGEILYVGSYEVKARTNKVVKKTSNISTANETLVTFPQVTGELKEAIVYPVTSRCIKEEFQKGLIAGGRNVCTFLKVTPIGASFSSP